LEKIGLQGVLAGFGPGCEAGPGEATLAEDDVPDQWEVFKEINRVYFEQGHEAGERMVAEFIAKKGA